MGSEQATSNFDALWENHAADVRRYLVSFGVGPTDLDDLAQEVFLVAHEHGDDLASIQQPEAWLREVCRRIAAGHRRRAHRHREIAYGEPPEPAIPPSVDSELEEREAVDRLHHALARLDEESRDLVALHELGNLPLTDMAALVAADRKTVTKRLGIALRRLTNFFTSDDDLQGGPASGVRPSTRPSTPPTDRPVFQLLARHRDVNIGLLGNVLIAVWAGPPTLEALEQLDELIVRATQMCRSSVAYLAVVEATTKPPTLQARQKITQMLKDHADHFHVYVTALEGGAAWIARPIMTALLLLSRPPFPTQFSQGTASASRWLANHLGPEANVSADEVFAAVERLRAPEPSSR